MVGRSMYVLPLSLAVAVTAVAVQGALGQSLRAQSGAPKIVCGYDPNTGTPNPLGMRAFITLTETDGTTEVRYEQLGSFVPGPVEAVLTTERSLIFPNRSIDRVRQLLVSDGAYYRELLGFEDTEGFAPVNSSLVCQAETVAARPVQPRPAAELPDLSGERPRSELPDLSNPVPGRAPQSPAGVATPSTATPATFYDTVAGLADGNYRYVSGPAEDRVYSEQELVRRGGVLFVFRKTGDEITGAYSYIDGESICVTGRVSGNTVSGQAYPANGVARELTEAFVPWGPANFLRVRRTQGDVGNRYYGSATLELNDFSQINAGSSLPPSRCG